MLKISRTELVCSLSILGFEEYSESFENLLHKGNGEVIPIYGNLIYFENKETGERIYEKTLKDLFGECLDFRDFLEELNK